MAAYIILYNFTEQGIKNAKSSVERAKAAKEAAEKTGFRIIGMWWTLGQYDGVVIAEGPDDEAVTRQLLALGMQGNIRTTTLRAFSEDEMERIVKAL